MGFFHPCGSVLSVSGLGSEALAFFYLRTLSEEDCSGSVFSELSQSLSLSALRIRPFSASTSYSYSILP